MLVTDRHRALAPLPDLVEAAISGGVDAVQLREPDLDEGEVQRLGSTLARICEGRALFVVNNDPSLASELGAGLHLPEAAARRGSGPLPFISRAVHSRQSAAMAHDYDALIAGHVFPSASKPGRPPLTLAGLGSIVQATPLPVIAIGGIDQTNVASVIAAGARGVAIIGSIATAADPEAAARAIREAVDEAICRYDERRGQAMTTGATDTSVDVEINGRHESFSKGVTLLDILAERRLSTKLVAVERNGEIVPRDHFETTRLAEGDRLEIVHFVGGG
ncbi:MAG TPA: sulfur carrier protein ThiS [Thermomicrobiales bacterium]|nr:sulfur carrier protein ThiS [Thermomicrobiales bacterium]